MPGDDLIKHGAHIMTVCNACRYCEQYCPVFPAMEERRVFLLRDLEYLANLCHNCGECLYACQYAPPHEFGIDVPRTLARIRNHSYEAHAWPSWLASAFRRNSTASAVVLSIVWSGVLGTAVLFTNPRGLSSPGNGADFYQVVPHGAMVAVFGLAGFLVLLALGVAAARFWRDLGGGALGVTPRTLRRAIGDALTLRHLHGTGLACVISEEHHTPWRRWWHHATFYGFLLCFASTTVAAGYHAVGFEAPYAYSSVPVLLGTVGGLGLLTGTAGLWLLARRRDPNLTDAGSIGLDAALTTLLLVTSLTGLALLALRHTPVMGALLVVHLGAVLALFLTLPYGKFMHGLYRALALVRYAADTDDSRR
jgi:citrate/tricarballylate utilization protein